MVCAYKPKGGRLISFNNFYYYFKMKKNMLLEGLRWNRDSGSALYVTPQTAVLGRAGSGE